MLALISMGFDPASTPAIFDSCREDHVAITDMVEDIADASRRYQLGSMLQGASVVRAGMSSGKEGNQAYSRWRNDIIGQMKPKPKRTVFDRLARAEPKGPSTVWDKLGGARGV